MNKGAIVLIRLIAEYEKALKDIVSKRKTADKTDDALYSGMESDLRYALQWMKTGKEPGTIRGIERQSGEVRDVSVDPIQMQRYFRSTDSMDYAWDNHDQENAVSRSEKERLEFALSALSDKQREIYMLVRGKGLTYDQAANIMGMKRSAISSSLERSDWNIRKKLRKYNSDQVSGWANAY